MRKIENEMIAAVRARRNYKNTNTEVINFQDGSVFVKLYNTIIYAVVNGLELWSDGGYSTATTASRLRALGIRYSRSIYANNEGMTEQNAMKEHYYKSLLSE